MASARSAPRTPAPAPRTAGASTPRRRGRPSALGEFLHGRRVRVAPESVGIVSDRRRRQVPGLRREEIAELAGISADYYTRLEQGRERRPSAQVIGAIARALLLDDDEIGHLFLLAGQAVPSVPAPQAALGADLRALLHPSLLRVPVTVLGPALDIVEINPVGAALYSGFAKTENLVRMVFCDPVAREFYEEWDLTARAKVASLRASSAQFPGDPRINAIVSELSARSEHFESLWQAQEIRLDPCPETHLIHHPLVGDLHLYCNTFAVVSVPGQRLHVFTPEPGGESARRVEQLAATGD
ncbi:helix-turn-helix domain-containing protein [Streptomyces sp. SL13]|uniref:Helix-turn-helix domain-containing protein n=1 Tax=Streptantibioticus silvisoli TaxID=2705255 RepID=A0AA90JYA5_9ACTN|nr:helix-turn-helix domain-containing protein [Streptantibioticus silvisoli]MDI5961220.1 helix-turn-helix domain-containing protein [Streptantibioticus silvisoli]MDI5971021.1 helix-turn-helix domain-containing protein [Streptantibioticus silvisoli]